MYGYNKIPIVDPGFKIEGGEQRSGGFYYYILFFIY